MPPPLRPFNVKPAEAFVGVGGIKQYFSVTALKRPQGRPRKKRRTDRAPETNIPYPETPSHPPIAAANSFATGTVKKT